MQRSANSTPFGTNIRQRDGGSGAQSYCRGCDRRGESGSRAAAALDAYPIQMPQKPFLLLLRAQARAKNPGSLCPLRMTNLAIYYGFPAER